MANIDSRTRSVVGRAPPGGRRVRRPRAVPAMIRVTDDGPGGGRSCTGHLRVVGTVGTQRDAPAVVHPRRARRTYRDPAPGVTPAAGRCSVAHQESGGSAPGPSEVRGVGIPSCASAQSRPRVRPAPTGRRPVRRVLRRCRQAGFDGWRSQPAWVFRTWWRRHSGPRFDGDVAPSGPRDCVVEVAALGRPAASGHPAVRLPRTHQAGDGLSGNVAAGPGADHGTSGRVGDPGPPGALSGQRAGHVRRRSDPGLGRQRDHQPGPAAWRGTRPR